jgi:hypothetical protein
MTDVSIVSGVSTLLTPRERGFFLLCSSWLTYRYAASPKDAAGKEGIEGGQKGAATCTCSEYLDEPLKVNYFMVIREMSGR